MHLIDALAAGIRGAEQGYAYLYRRGTSSRIAWYDDFEGASVHPATEQVSLDVYGAAEVYVDELATVVVYNSDGTQVREFVAGSNASGVEVTSPSFTGANYETALAGTSEPTHLGAVLDLWESTNGAPDWLISYLGSNVSIAEAIASSLYFNVKSAAYGAVGDGVADDTDAIQDAADAAAVNGGVVFFPPGTYKITATIDLADRVSVLGCGPRATTVSVASGADNAFALALSTTSYLTGTQFIRDLSIVPAYDMSGASPSALINYASGAAELLIDNCYLGDATNEVLDHVLVATTNDAARVTISRCVFVMAPYSGAGARYVVDGAAAEAVIRVDGCTFVAASGSQDGTSCVYIKRGAVTNTHFDLSAQSAGNCYALQGVGNSLLYAVAMVGCSGEKGSGGTSWAFQTTTGSLFEEYGNSMSGFQASSAGLYAGTNTYAGSHITLRNGRHDSSSSGAGTATIDANTRATYTLTATAATLTFAFANSPTCVGLTFLLTVRSTNAGGTTLTLAPNYMEAAWLDTVVNGVGINLAEAVPFNQSHHLVFMSQRDSSGNLWWVNTMRRRGSAF
jgi:hypothetical protein